jgi:SET and MYND domain-containing protein 4
MNLKEEDFKLFEQKLATSSKGKDVSYRNFINVCQEVTGAKIVDEYNSLLHDASHRDKLSQSELFRKLGNDVLNLKKYHKAVEFYTRSVAWAPKGSSARGQAFANRSAVLEMTEHYQECIEDVNRALANDYPQMLRFKLYVRQAQCHRELKNMTEAEKAIAEAKNCIGELKLPEEKKKQLVASVDRDYSAALVPKAQKLSENYPEPLIVSYGKNPEAPSMSSAVSIAYDDKFGRHLVASKDIQAGTCTRSNFN